MENLIFCLNATTPVFMTMISGYFFRRIHLFDVAFLSRMNKFVFIVTLSVLLFEDISTTGLRKVWGILFVAFCFLATPLFILSSVAAPYRSKDRNIQGEFVQASCRSSAAILGIVFIQNTYGNSGIAPLMIAAIVPLYDTIAVIVLLLMKPKRGILRKELILQTGRDILRNPIILEIGIGMLWSLLRVPQPVAPQESLHNLGALVTPLSLMAMGGSFEFHDFYAKRRPIPICSFMKLILFAVVFLPVIVSLGFVNNEPAATLIILGLATMASYYITARNMGHKGALSGNVVMMTTLGSAFTLTAQLYISENSGTLQKKTVCN